jgi:hypothetical protein
VACFSHDSPAPGPLAEPSGPDTEVPIMAMIQIWRGRVTPGRAEEFDRWLRDEAIPELRRDADLEALHVGRTRADHCVLVTVWRDGLDAGPPPMGARALDVLSPPEGLLAHVVAIERYSAVSEELSNPVLGSQ